MHQTKKILLAEDNLALGNVVKFNLERAGFTVSYARNGKIAWEMIQDELFDLLITDQQMPEMNGVDLCRNIREDLGDFETPIFMLTAKGLELDRQMLREELGITNTFAKPFSPKSLVKSIEELFSLSKCAD